MFLLKFIFLIYLFKSAFSLNNTLNKNLESIRIIQNTPVENNIPLIIQDLDKNNNINQNIINKNPFSIPIILPNNQNNNNIVITDTLIKINTTNKNPMCTKECCMGCEVQFPKLISQKNCIINICKCQIISISHIKNDTNTGLNHKINEVNTEIDDIILIGSMNNNNINLNNNENNYSYLYYWFIMCIFVFYEGYILYNFNIKNNKFIVEINNNNQNTLKEKNNKQKINDYMELLYGEEELIECLI